MQEIDSTKTFYFIKPLWNNLSKKRKKQLLICLQLIILNGILDLVSVTSVLPLLYLLTSNPQDVMDNNFVMLISDALRISDPNILLSYSAIIFAVVAVFSGFLRLSNLYFSSRLSGSIASDLSDKIFSRVLFQSYSYHLDLNSSEVITVISTYINDLNSGLINTLQFITSFILSIFITLGILLVNWQLSIFGFLIYSIIYLAISKYGRKRLNFNSKVIAESNILIVKGVQEALGSIREIILDDSHKYYIGLHKKLEYRLRRLVAKNIFLSFFPRYAIEALTLLLISLIILFKDLLFGSNFPILPTLGGLAIGLQKLLPSFQSLYTSWAQVNAQKSSIFKLLQFLKLNLKNENDLKSKNYEKYSFLDSKFSFKSLKLSNVSYRYNSNKKYIFKNLNLKIKQGEFLGIIGKTGDGKSTLLDLIMGLIYPSSGVVSVNGQDISESVSFLRSWRKEISHVPQNIYLLDKTIAENIAFGLNKKEINMEKLIKCSREAKINDFINSLPEKYNSMVGERGMKISGGQRQRIGLARALYDFPKILVLDEATSALDEETEKNIMETILKIKKDITLIVVAHRLKTIKYCDRVIKLENGEIVFDGKPEEIIN